MGSGRGRRRRSCVIWASILSNAPLAALAAPEIDPPPRPATAARPPLAPVDPQPPLYPSGDPWSLQDHRLAHTRLIDQLRQPDQAHRYFAGERGLVLTADGLVSTSVPRFGSDVASWHGYFAVDANLSARPVKGLDFNLNAVGTQRSASNGYRATSEVRPGFTGHWYGDLFALAGAPVRGDLVALDLGEITVGKGLLFEREWLQGALGRLTWLDLSFEFFIGGQTYSIADDLFATTLRWGRNGPALSWLMWPQFQFEQVPHYLSFSSDLPGLGDHFRLGLEAVLRLPSGGGGKAGAGMVRADWLPHAGQTGRWQLHLGYQFRVYQQGLSPVPQRIDTPSIFTPLPWLDDTYVTHPTEYVFNTAWYHQWSHTVMIENKLRITRKVGVQAELEGRAWFFDDPQSPARISVRPVNSPGQDSAPLLPSAQIDLYYRLWLTLHPFEGLPYRLRGGVANVFAGWADPWAQARLEKRGPFVVLDMEVPL